MCICRAYSGNFQRNLYKRFCVSWYTMSDAILSTTSKENIANDTGAVTFLCPKCGFDSIVRSSRERKNVTTYTCPKCGFVGPN